MASRRSAGREEMYSSTVRAALETIRRCYNDSVHESTPAGGRPADRCRRRASAGAVALAIAPARGAPLGPHGQDIEVGQQTSPHQRWPDGQQWLNEQTCD